jgi:hypothetical protein
VKAPIILIVVVAILTAPAFAAFQRGVKELPTPLPENENSPFSSGLLFAQAQAPGRPLTADEQRRMQTPQPPVRDPLVRTEPPPPPRSTPTPRTGGVGAVRD